MMMMAYLFSCADSPVAEPWIKHIQALVIGATLFKCGSGLSGFPKPTPFLGILPTPRMLQGSFIWGCHKRP